MSPSCEQFKSSLLELAYGELSDATADELRTHATSCQSCREALEQVMLIRKLASQLPEIDPGEDLDPAILDAARDAARDLSSQNTQKTDLKTADSYLPSVPVSERPGFGERLRAFLLTPALVTAAVATLVFVISIFIAEKGTHMDRQHKMEIQAPLTSAEEPALKPPAKPAYEKSLAESEKTLALREKARGSSSDTIASAPSPARSRSNDDTRSFGTSAKRSRSKAGNLGTAMLERTPDAVDEAEPKAKALTDQGFHDDSPSGFDLKGSPSSKARAPKKWAREEIGTIPSSRPVRGDDDFDRGIAAYARGDCNVATAAFFNVAEQPSADSSKTAFAIHHIARCEKRRGRCGKALPWYDKLLTRFHEYKGRTEALWEAARCHRRLGHIKRARGLLEELSFVPGWETKANGEIERISK